MKTVRRQSGFGVVAVLLIIVAIAAVAGGGYAVYHANQTKPTTSATTSKGISNNKQAETSVSSNTVLKISQWSGISFSYDAPLTKLGYTYDEQSDHVTFTSDLEADLPAACASVKGSWGVTRYAAGHITDANGEPLSDAQVADNRFFKHIGSYYYRFTYPSGPGCTDQADYNRVAAVDQAYKNTFGVFDNVTD